MLKSCLTVEDCLADVTHAQPSRLKESASADDTLGNYPTRHFRVEGQSIYAILHILPNVQVCILANRSHDEFTF